MIDYGQVPSNKKCLKALLYPFHNKYPKKFWSKYRWWKNSKINELLNDLNENNEWLTVVDRLGAPGDSLITANVIRCLKNAFPKLRINCITPNPEIIKLDPNIDSINLKETFYSIDSSYWELIVRKDNNTNIINHNLEKLGINEFEYKSEFYFTHEEKVWASKTIHLIENNKKPLISICTKSKEDVKNWPEQNWRLLVNKLKSNFTIIHLGDDNEPSFDGVEQFASKLTIRESAAILSKTDLFIGPDSLLMHVANGCNIRSVIIFGGSRPVKCFGYNQNINLSSYPKCSPCWIHKGYEECNKNLQCLHEISVKQVLSSVNRILQN